VEVLSHTRIATGIFQESDRRFGIASPWHGVEYDIETGICHPNQKMRLRRFEVVLTNGSVMLKVQVGNSER